MYKSVRGNGGGGGGGAHLLQSYFFSAVLGIIQWPEQVKRNSLRFAMKIKLSSLHDFDSISKNGCFRYYFWSVTFTLYSNASIQNIWLKKREREGKRNRKKKMKCELDAEPIFWDICNGTNFWIGLTNLMLVNNGRCGIFSM